MNSKLTIKERKEENKSILQEVYDMDLDTLRKYCIDLLKRNAEYYRKDNDSHAEVQKEVVLCGSSSISNPLHETLPSDGSMTAEEIADAYNEGGWENVPFCKSVFYPAEAYEELKKEIELHNNPDEYWIDSDYNLCWRQRIIGRNSDIEAMKSELSSFKQKAISIIKEECRNYPSRFMDTQEFLGNRIIEKLSLSQPQNQEDKKGGKE